jgi:hypothetical protein
VAAGHRARCRRQLGPGPVELGQRAPRPFGKARPRPKTAAGRSLLTAILGLVGDAGRMRYRLAAYAGAGIDIFAVAPSGCTPEEKLTVLRTVAALAT